MSLSNRQLRNRNKQLLEVLERLSISNQQLYTLVVASLHTYGGDAKELRFPANTPAPRVSFEASVEPDGSIKVSLSPEAATEPTPEVAAAEQVL